MDLDEDYTDTLQKIHSQFRRNKFSSIPCLIKDDLGALDGDMLDQIQPSLLEEDIQDILGKVVVYASLVGTLAHIPENEEASREVKGFIDAHKPEFIALKKEVKDAESKARRILYGKTKMNVVLVQANRGASSASSSSFFELPRLQVSQFQANQTGTINWANFHSIFLRMTSVMNA